MKYITEDDLRDLYKKEPFTNYDLELGARLTPGARQFLVDRGINMIDTDSGSTEKNAQAKPVDQKTAEDKNTCKANKLYYRMKSLDALFLISAEELLSRDVYLAQSVIKLGRQFSGIKNIIKNKAPIESLCFNECTGINKKNYSDDLDDCFEISEFHIQLEKGREIIVLHRLRCALNEVKLTILEVYEHDDDAAGLYEDIISNVNQIVNSLSQLICSAIGGKKCQRQH